ncbi:ABC transporter ATP-binding protein [Oricola sp.]|uniref:ABC transporter ATP-binding protein n=1 Tax=Oricola sp. TaxID=1979950 RepID=UPI003BACE60C
MTAARIETRDVSWAPRNGPTVLHPVSITVEPGRTLAVVGANGAGKSTFLRMLYRYRRPSTGAVLIDGEDIWSMDARHAARRIAAVLQEQPQEFGLTVAEIVKLGRAPYHSGFVVGGAKDRLVVEAALERLELSALAGRTFATLSGGEKQRVMVARALAQEPSVLILDEPTNHLDIRHQLELLGLIRNLGITIVASLHDLNFASRYADDVIVLANGYTLAAGPAGEVLTEELVSGAFSVMARSERLVPSEQTHFTFHLEHGVS